jgi:ABC-type sugar transport system substrate-binding protein
MKKVVTIVFAIALVLALVACGNKKEEEDGVVVGYLAKNTVDAFHATLNGAGRAILDKYIKDGVIKSWQFYDAQTDPSTQVSQLEDAISNGCNFIVFLPVEAVGSDPVVTRCAELGIPCIPINSYTTSTFEKATAYAGSNDVQAGEMMAEYIMGKISGGGKFAHMMGVVGSSAQIDRGNGVASLMNAASRWTNVGDYAAEWLAEKAVGFTADVITQHGDTLKAIVCDNDDMSSAVQAYCNSIGREDIVCIGVDGNAGPLQMVKDGTLGATVFQDGVGQMTYALELIPYIIAGDKTTKEYFNSEIPFILVTKENVDLYF